MEVLACDYSGGGCVSRGVRVVCIVMGDDR